MEEKAITDCGLPSDTLIRYTLKPGETVNGPDPGPYNACGRRPYPNTQATLKIELCPGCAKRAGVIW